MTAGIVEFFVGFNALRFTCSISESLLFFVMQVMVGKKSSDIPSRLKHMGIWGEKGEKRVPVISLSNLHF